MLIHACIYRNKMTNSIIAANPRHVDRAALLQIHGGGVCLALRHQGGARLFEPAQSGQGI